MLKIPRYNVGAIDNEVIRWDQAESGEWCEWEDVEKILAHVAELRADAIRDRDRLDFFAQGKLCPWCCCPVVGRSYRWMDNEPMHTGCAVTASAKRDDGEARCVFGEVGRC